MKNRSKYLFTVVGLALAASAALADFRPLKFDNVHSRIGFTASTLLFDVDGHFDKYDVTVDGDPTQPTKAKVLISIETASIKTGIDKRDEHLRGEDFLDAKKYPKITFTSETITQTAGGVNVTGTLDLHGKKNKVTIPFKIAKGKNGAGVQSTAYKGKLNINRKDYGIGSDSIAAKISLEDEIALDLLLVSFE